MADFIDSQVAGKILSFADSIGPLIVKYKLFKITLVSWLDPQNQ
jgi:hypothetical protein